MTMTRAEVEAARATHDFGSSDHCRWCGAEEMETDHVPCTGPEADETRNCDECRGTGRDGWGESCVTCWGTGSVSECHGSPVMDGRCWACTTTAVR
jgi:hypothetical protein